MTDPNANQPPEKPNVLPKLRKGLTFAFGDYDIEGKPQWLIHDAGRAKFFIIGWVEFEILERWHLGTLEAVIDAVNTETTLHVDKEDVEHLLTFLAHNYLIQQSGYQILRSAIEQKLFKNDNKLSWLISYYLFFKIPLFHPDKWLTRTKRIGDIVFSRTAGYIMSFLALFALYQLSIRWDEFTHTFASIFTLQGLFFSLIAYVICKFCHELGHAYMCKRYGIPVPTLGVAFLVFWPVLYTDTTLSWTLNSQQRLRIALAGMWVETYVTIIAALIWCNVHNITIQSICYVTITVNWMASLLINVSPFMRFDGYYVLADLLKMPNLQPRAFALTRWQIRRWLFDWTDPPPEKFTPRLHYFLVAYSIITWLYRLFIYFGIAILVYKFFIKLVGIVLFIVELFYFILRPFVSEVQYWIQHKDKFTLNTRTKISASMAIIICLLFFIPIHSTVKLPGTLSYAHEFLIAPDEGVLQNSLPAIGTHIAANQPIVSIKSPEVEHELEETKLEYQKKMDELRRASINTNYTAQKSILFSDINKERSKYNKLSELRAKLMLSVPFDGVIIDTASDLKAGTTVMKDEWLGDVIKPDHLQGEAFVSEMDRNYIDINATGYFYPNDLSEPAVPIKITSIEALNANKLSCQYLTKLRQNKKDNIVVETPCYQVSELGGEIASLFTDDGNYVPVDSVFRVLFTVQKPTELTTVERGTIVIKTKPVSYAYRFFYQLKTIGVKESEF